MALDARALGFPACEGFPLLPTSSDPMFAFVSKYARAASLLKPLISHYRDDPR